jgi:tRNA A-37 threonylcarbamoyl transferase component Bud32
MIEDQQQAIAELRQATEDQHEMITELAQIIKSDQNALMDISLSSLEKLIDHTERIEVILDNQQMQIEEQSAQIEGLRELLRRMIVDADPRQVTHIGKLAGRLHRVDIAIDDQQVAIEEQSAEIEN